MTIYIKPRRQSKALAFILGFLTGFVSFVLVIAIVGYFAFYGLTIRDIESVTDSTIISESSGLSFAKNITLNDVVRSVSTTSKSGNITINTLEESLGKDIDIDLNKILPKNIDLELIEGYLHDYAGYDSLKDVPVDKLGTVLKDLIEHFTLTDIIAITDMFRLGLDKYYTQFGLDNFDSVIEFVKNGEYDSLKELEVLSLPSSLLEVVQLARIVDVVNVVNGYMKDKDVYTILSELSEGLNLSYSVEEVQDIIAGISSVFGEDSSLLYSVKNLSMLFSADIATVLAINEKTSLQFMPFTKQSTLDELGDILNYYFGYITLNKIDNAETVGLSAQIQYDDSTTIISLGADENYKDMLLKNLRVVK